MLQVKTRVPGSETWISLGGLRLSTRTTVHGAIGEEEVDFLLATIEENESDRRKGRKLKK